MLPNNSSRRIGISIAMEAAATNWRHRQTMRHATKTCATFATFMRRLCDALIYL
jgi:hypothetical protein